MLKIVSHLLFSNFFYLLKQLLIELEQLQHFDVICYVCFPVYSSLFPITSLPPNTNSIQHLGRGNYLFLSPFFSSHSFSQAILLCPTMTCLHKNDRWSSWVTGGYIILRKASAAEKVPILLLALGLRMYIASHTWSHSYQLSNILKMITVN